MGIGGRKGLVLLLVDVVPLGWAGVVTLVGMRVFVAHWRSFRNTTGWVSPMTLQVCPSFRSAALR